MKGPTQTSVASGWPRDKGPVHPSISDHTLRGGPAGLKTTQCSINAPSNFLTGHLMDPSFCEEQTL